MKKIGVVLILMTLLSGCSNAKKDGGCPFAGENAMSAEFQKNRGDRVHFDLNKDHIRDEGAAILDAQACWFKSHPKAKAVIAGHCDDRGTTEYNLALGERRANTVKKYLESKGVESERLSTVSYGKDKPIVPGTSAAARAQNRVGITEPRCN
ncbi:Peptidoglycan-associated lipoprotein [Rickettsiales endosymbiont of Paramecium tredecaurelia]|uniref:OmpA family protein n=1 Tax=Candidatus Sarmatiella mevalonica TaxID=2770581 RepID=UPI001924E10A|nr:OmpA family protein [Candidatus Sarmatiella mevalonica]MBL3285055.1 Peptidoglycan-associated lipoprotein [Candidatus Sarmatiella mevalonica]